MAAAAAAAEPASDKLKNHMRPHELIPEHIKSREKIDVSIVQLQLKELLLRVCPTQLCLKQQLATQSTTALAAE
jgi:hypothetical protein